MDIEARNRIEKYIKGTNYRLIEFTVKGDQRNKIYEVFVDCRGKLEVEELAKINREIWDLLESKELTKGVSKIMVSSPGVDKRFKYIWQLLKHMGRTLDIELKSGDTLSGKLQEITEEPDEKIYIKIPKKKKDDEDKFEWINFNDISECKVKIKY
jgi:ribosome maturation factor RimP